MYTLGQMLLVVGCTAWLTSAIWLLVWSCVESDGDNWQRVLGRHEGRAELVAAFAAYCDSRIGLCELVAQVPELRAEYDVVADAAAVVTQVWGES